MAVGAPTESVRADVALAALSGFADRSKEDSSRCGRT
jgi:hypothetical protein